MSKPTKPSKPNKPLPRKDRLLSTAQAADHLGVSVKTIRNYMARGLITPHRVGPKLLKFDPAELDAIISRAR